MSFELRVFLFLVSLSGFIFVISKIRKSKIRIDDAIFWIFSSLFFLSISIFPSIIMKASLILGFQSSANLVFLLVVGLTLFKLFLISISLSTLTEKNSTLVQHIAILEKKLLDKEKQPNDF